MSSIAYLDKHYHSILFRGFHHLEEHKTNGWVYWLPRYIHKNTGLKVYFLTNDNELLHLDTENKLHTLTRDQISRVDIFFGRTANSFNPDDPLILSAKKKIVYPIKNDIPDFYHGHNISIVNDAAFIKPIPDYDRQYFYYKSDIKKEKILLFPAGIQKRKGQLDFAKKVSKSVIKNHKLILCGTIKSEKYADNCFSTLKKRGIDFEYLSKVDKSTLGDLYRKAQLTLIFSRSDWNPRTFYESMACGTPALLSRNVMLAESLEPIAFRSSKFWLNNSIKKTLAYTAEHREALHNNAMALTEERCYETLFSMIIAE